MSAGCSVDGCEGKAYARGWCKPHYQRWCKHGDVKADVPLQRHVPKATSIADAYQRASADEVFLDRIRRDCVPSDEGCLLWTGSRTGTGYGQVRYAGHMLYVHVVILMASTSERPAGLDAGHICHDIAAHDGLCDTTGGTICRHRLCCEPSHLEWQSRKDNANSSPLTVNSINSAKETCPQGHPLVEGNLVLSKLARGMRECLTCNREHARVQAVKTKAAREHLGFDQQTFRAVFSESRDVLDAVLAGEWDHLAARHSVVASKRRHPSQRGLVEVAA